MNVALILWKKDFRRYGWLGVLTALAILFRDTHPLFESGRGTSPFSNFSFSDYFPSFAWVAFLKWSAICVAVVLLIQSDSFRVETAFWKTRPVSRKALVLAKAMSLCLYIFLPAVIAISWRLILIRADGPGAIQAIRYVLQWYLAVVAVTVLGAASTRSFFTGLLWASASLLVLTPVLTIINSTIVNGVHPADTARLPLEVGLLILVLIAYQVAFRRVWVTSLLLLGMAGTLGILTDPVNSVEFFLGPRWWVNQIAKPVANATPAGGVLSVVAKSDLYGGPTNTGLANFMYDTVVSPWEIHGADDSQLAVVVHAESTIREANGRVTHLPPAQGMVRVLREPGDGPLLASLGFRTQPQPWVYPPTMTLKGDSWRNYTVPLFSAPFNSWIDPAFRPRGRLETTLYLQQVPFRVDLHMPVFDGSASAGHGRRLSFSGVHWTEAGGLEMDFDDQKLPSPYGSTTELFGVGDILLLANRKTHEYSRVESRGYWGQLIQPITEVQGTFAFKKIRRNGEDTGAIVTAEWTRNAEFVRLSPVLTGPVVYVKASVDHIELYRRTTDSTPVPTVRRHPLGFVMPNENF